MFGGSEEFTEKAARWWEYELVHISSNRESESSSLDSEAGITFTVFFPSPTSQRMPDLLK